jgi:hypothetical protein
VRRSRRDDGFVVDLVTSGGRRAGSAELTRSTACRKERPKLAKAGSSDE